MAMMTYIINDLFAKNIGFCIEAFLLSETLSFNAETSMNQCQFSICEYLKF